MQLPSPLSSEENHSRIQKQRTSAAGDMSSPIQSTEQIQARLADLTARAAAKDAIKDFDAAAELYSQATELQAEWNGEMSIGNADLLYAYGKSLYNVAVSKSDVLGTKITEDHAPAENAAPSPSPMNEGLIRNATTSVATRNVLGTENPAQTKSHKNQQYFQFTGDENFDDSGSDEENRADEPDEDDDFANAFEVLDLARILSLRKLEQTEKGKSGDMSPEMKCIKERLADIYDLQAEISLEGERFADAVMDLKAALELKEELCPLEDASVAECHYKLSLALDFLSVTRDGDGDEPSADSKIASVDTAMKNEAAWHMETAIKSCKIRMSDEEQKLINGEVMEEDKVNVVRRKIVNVKDIIMDMEQRLVDLRRPPVSISDPDQTTDELNTLNGILGQIIGKTPAEQKARLDDVAKSANDLTALVRKKAPSDSSNGKRAHDSGVQEESVKRTKVGDSP